MQTVATGDTVISRGPCCGINSHHVEFKHFALWPFETDFVLERTFNLVYCLCSAKAKGCTMLRVVDMT